MQPEIRHGGSWSARTLRTGLRTRDLHGARIFALVIALLYLTATDTPARLTAPPTRSCIGTAAPGTVLAGMRTFT